MISTKETVTVRLEVDLTVLAGELRVMEDDLERMSLSQFLEVWGPEKTGARAMLKLITIGEEDGRNKRSKGKETKEEIPTSNDSQV